MFYVNIYTSMLCFYVLCSIFLCVDPGTGTSLVFLSFLPEVVQPTVLPLSMAQGGQDMKLQSTETGTRPKESVSVHDLISSLDARHYKVLTTEEYEQLLALGGAGKTSTPMRKGRGRARISSSVFDDVTVGKENIRSPSRGESVLSSTGNQGIVVPRTPKIPPFSGDDQKGDVTFNVWRCEVRCLMREDSYPVSTVRQAIRQSLRGTARQMLTTLRDDASSELIIEKLNGLFGNVATHEATLQKFYSETQQEGESVVSFACRLESLLQSAIESGHIEDSAKDGMLRSKFWTSLGSERLKNQTRHRYDTVGTFDSLVREVRAVDLEIKNADKVKGGNSKKPTQHQPVQVEQDLSSKLDLLVNQVSDLASKLRSLETKVDSKFCRNSHGPPQNKSAGNYRKEKDEGKKDKNRSSNKSPKLPKE
ncbi:uncharacterized protein [Argopecten irradians]|uniref:uncharacterized protein n=1 Tax=Argopecten irradians TaxID=31199 RepID=UPI0037142C0F